MAELAVRMPYTNKARSTALSSMKLTFPIWGVAAPITAFCIFMTAYFQFMSDRKLDQHLLVTMCTIGALVLILVVGLMIVNWLSSDSLSIDKEGITLPLSLTSMCGLSERMLSWSSITKVYVSWPDEDWRKRQIALVTSRKTYRLGLTHMNQEDVEKLVLAVEMWGKSPEVDQSLKDLKTQVTSTSDKALTFTGMWEDELSRRFCATAFVPLEPGRLVRNGSVRIVRHLALGGLSAVYLCQLDDKKLVVLKEAVVAEDAKESLQVKAREMLEREATMLMKLSHPNIVRVLDHFVEQGRSYLLLDYINGQDLRQLVIQNGPQREEIVIDWALQMVTILKYLHEQEPPVIHRDFTPDNLVLCDDGSIVVIDFGAANEYIGTATGTFVGKHAFIAPEQFRGKAVVQSDLYALGCTLHFLLTGQEPEALSMSDPREINATISKELCEVVTTCTNMDASSRYQSASQLIPILRGLASSLPTAI